MNLLASPVLATVAAQGENAPLDLSSHAAGAQAAGGGSLVRTIVGLAIVLAVIFGLRWVLKQVKEGREEKASGSGLTPMATLPLGSNRSLHVVRAGSEVLVVGSGEHGVTPVRAYGEQEARTLGLLAPEEAGAAAPPPNKSAVATTASIAAKRTLDTLRAWTVRG